MKRLSAVLRAALLSALMLSAPHFSACAPEVVLARHDQQGGSAGQAPGGSSGEGAQAAASGEAGAGGESGAAEGGAPPDIDVPRIRVLADSVADFSMTQGERGWTYGYDDGSVANFTPLTRASVITAYVPPTSDIWDCWTTEEASWTWTQIFQLGAHPNGLDTSSPSMPVLQRAVRRWTSNYAGNVRILGEIAKIDVAVGGSNGVDASVVIDGVELFTQFIGGEDGGGLSYELAAPIMLGSTLDFVLDPHESADHHDLTRFTAIVELAATARGD